MNITNTIVKQVPSKFYPEHPYVLYIEDYGPVGDKLNCDVSSNGKSFPRRASGRFKTKKKAEEILALFLAYVKAKIEDAKRKGHSEKKNPSYYLWK